MRVGFLQGDGLTFQFRDLGLMGVGVNEPDFEPVDRQLRNFKFGTFVDVLNNQAQSPDNQAIQKKLRENANSIHIFNYQQVGRVSRFRSSRTYEAILVVREQEGAVFIRWGLDVQDDRIRLFSLEDRLT